MKIKELFIYSSFSVFLLICFILLTLSQSNAAKSKYQSGAVGNQAASVAKWDVSVTPVSANNTIDVIAGNNAVNYSIRVTNNSQVSCNYTIKISNVPDGLKVSLDDGTEQLPTNNIVTFENVGSFIIGNATQERTHKLSFGADSNTNAFDDDIYIDVIFTQIN